MAGDLSGTPKMYSTVGQFLTVINRDEDLALFYHHGHVRGNSEGHHADQKPPSDNSRLTSWRSYKLSIQEGMEEKCAIKKVWAPIGTLGHLSPLPDRGASYNTAFRGAWHVVCCPLSSPASP